MNLKESRIASANGKFVYIRARYESEIMSAFDAKIPYMETVPQGTFIVDIEELSMLSFYGDVPDVYKVILSPSTPGLVKIERIRDKKRAVAIAKVIDDVILSETEVDRQ